MKYFDIGFDGYWNNIYHRFTNYAHVFLGVSIFLLCYFIFRLIMRRVNANSKVYSILNLSDKYSFDIFFVHPFFISGSLAVTRFVDNKVLASILAIILSIIMAISFHSFDKGLWFIIGSIFRPSHQN